MLSVNDGYDIINFENQSQQSCLKFKFPAKTINQSESRRKSRQVFPWRAQCLLVCHWGKMCYTSPQSIELVFLSYNKETKYTNCH